MRAPIYYPSIYQRTSKGWGVYYLPAEILLIDGLDKGVAAGFAIILNGFEEEGWECVGRKTAKRKKLLEELIETVVDLGV